MLNLVQHLVPMIKPILLLPLAVFLTSCRSDFRLTADFEEIPVIYGLLNVSDSVNYVRIQRAYLDQDGSAYYWSQVPDSIYYADVLDVTIEELGTGMIWTLDRVDGDSLGLSKDPGTFASTQNILYRLKAHLDPDETYLLTVRYKQKDLTATAETGLVTDFFSLLPSHSYVINWSGAEGEKVAFSWHNARNANIYEMIIRFNYKEIKPSAPDSLKFVEWSVFGNFYTTAAEGTGLEIIWPTSAFFKRLGVHIPPSEDEIRQAQGVDFFLYAGGTELGNYVNNEIASSGITEAVVTPGYTNVSNGKGIFSSRFVKIFHDIPLGATALDSLMNGQYTNRLGFEE